MNVELERADEEVLAERFDVKAPEGLPPRMAASMVRCVAWALVGLNGKQIAERTGLSHGHVRNLLSAAKRLKVYEPRDVDRSLIDRMRTESMENLQELMHDDDKAIRLKTNLEVAKGLGELVQHANVKGAGLPGGGGGTSMDFTLTLNIVEPKRTVKDGDIIAGEIVGVPRELGQGEESGEQPTRAESRVTVSGTPRE